MEQLRQPNYLINTPAGLCLQHARSIYSIDRLYDPAWQAWQKVKYRHEDRNFPDASVPVWFDWWGDLHKGAGRQQYGHVAVRDKSGIIWSSPLSGTGRAWFKSVDDLVKAFGNGMKYVGWSEDINNVRVVQPKEEDMKADNYTVQALAEAILGRTAANDKNLQNNIGGDVNTVIDTIRSYPEAKARAEKANKYDTLKAEYDKLVASKGDTEPARKLQAIKDALK